ncbi:MAG: hypothetical protein EOO51_14245 [Flavobacterium sp.]|nr:MAG: hypothetical protein EOO51_14245 [Flavobacterium sp.]
MRLFLSILFFVVCFFGRAQDNKDVKGKPDTERKLLTDKPKESPKAAHDQYRIITLQRDTTYVDTSLTIQSEYRFNYLRKDSFGLMPFANEGQPYNILNFALTRFSPYPEFGYKAKHFNYIEADQVNYYSVATPLTELYFKTVMEQGQTLDAFITLNTSERLNFSVGYKGLRSLGKYINQLSSTGNFRFTTSYNTKNKRYYANFHFTSQDFLNGENGGIVSTDNFESGDNSFKNRARLEVYFKDAKSVMIGRRLFLDHSFMLNHKKGSNNIYLTHQFNYEYKFFEYSQPTVLSTITNDAGATYTLQRFGDAFVTSNIIDQARYNRMFNRAGVIYENATLGKFGFFADDFRYNYYFDKVIVFQNGTVPSSLNDEINSIGGQYEYQKGKWSGKLVYSNSINGPAMSNLEASAKYEFDEKDRISFRYQNENKIAEHIYDLHQSSYIGYNWFNDFNNEKINTIEAVAETKWANASLQLRTINDYLYFSNDDTTGQLQIVTPKQYDKTINYLSLKVSREFRWWKLALDNTILYQKVDQQDDILNVPQLTTRNTLYFSDYLFKRAMYLQTGITFQYFTKYYQDDYSPVLAELFVQNQKQIGNFPLMDFFVNARIRQTRIFLKAEHFNSAFTGNNYYSAPNYPYHDFMIRFGLVWNFFQ